MNTLIDWVIEHRRTTLITLLFLILAGLNAYQLIPRESSPDVAIPIIYVSMSHEGISPDDAERLLVRPMEKELKSIEGVKEMRANAGEGHASVTLEFEAGFDSAAALQDVRDKVDLAKPKLPAGGKEPEVHEVNVALFPVLSMTLSGPVPERQMMQIARKLRDDIEGLPGVLEVNLGGDREEVLEVIVDPVIMETYHLDFLTIFNTVSRNNQLVAAGALDNGAGRMVIKVPGVINGIQDILQLPVKTAGDTVITVGDIATVRKTFKDPTGFARIDGQPAISLEVKKRVGANIIRTIAQVKKIVDQRRSYWPTSLRQTYILDSSTQIKDMLTDLSNNVSSAVILVVIIVIGALGVSSGILVGLAIPASFLTGILVLYSMGYTLNIVVLFSLILVVGMLVDGAIVVTELATRNREQGYSNSQAFAAAAQRMAWPIIASTATTLAVFAPLIAWPGVMGQFMKFLPITVIICLTASLFMALLFLPALGGLMHRKISPAHIASTTTATQPNAAMRAYLRLLTALLHHPGKTLLVVLLLIAGSYGTYFKFGKGVEFFPNVEPESAQVLLHARGDLSIYEKDALLQRVEKRLVGMPEIKALYARSFNRGQSGIAEDVIGSLQFEFIHWDRRRLATEILAEMKQRTADLAGLQLEFRKASNGPSAGKPIKLQVSALLPSHMQQAADTIHQAMVKQTGLKDIEDDRPVPGIEWAMSVDRSKAGRYGADITTIGSAIQMVTTGLKVTDYRPDDSDQVVDIRVRFPKSQRAYDRLRELKIQTLKGLIPLSNFVTITPARKTGSISRVDAHRTVTLQADVMEGVLVNNALKALKATLTRADFPADVLVKVKGEGQDQKETTTFLSNAFFIALFLMIIILLTQFNSLYQSILILSAIVFSTAGILLGLLVTAQPFGIVMVGLGIIALAGIVVNNNIILIDTYNQFVREGLPSLQAAVNTGRLRLRPVLLTAGTTVLGLIPMVLSMNIDLLHRQVSFGAPSTQWWTQLSSAIAGGLSFATLLTLLLTPCLLVLGANTSTWIRRKRGLEDKDAEIKILPTVTKTIRSA